MMMTTIYYNTNFNEHYWDCLLGMATNSLILVCVPLVLIWSNYYLTLRIHNCTCVCNNCNNHIRYTYLSISLYIHVYMYIYTCTYIIIIIIPYISRRGEVWDFPFILPSRFEWITLIWLPNVIPENTINSTFSYRTCPKIH